MKSPRLLGALLASLLLVVPAIAQSDTPVRLPALFSDGAVLQRDSVITVWGWAEPGKMVTVNGTWRNSIQYTTAGDDGRFSVVLRTGEAGGPHELSVECGGQKTVVEDILLGEVWLCGGQSNMEWPLSASAPGSATLAASSSAPADWNQPRIRMFEVPHRVSHSPQTDVTAKWVSCTPETAQSFSGIGLHFANVLQQELDVPIGLIGSHWGGTPAESWTSEPTADGFPGLQAGLNQLRAQRNASGDGAGTRDAANRKWFLAANAADPGIAGGWKTSGDSEGWIDAPVPGIWKDLPDAGLSDFDGLVWYRRTVEIPDSWAGKDLALNLGPIDDMDAVYFQGKAVGVTLVPGKWQSPRRYRVSGRLVQGGSVTIAVRAIDTGGAGGITGEAALNSIHPFSDASEQISLAGTWKLRVGLPIAKLPATPGAASIGPNTPAGLYNGMLAPLAPYGIAGAIWYQGESNRTRFEEYRALFPAMITDWRTTFGADFPFYFVQIAPFGYGGDSGQAAELREAQRLALQLPGTGMAVTMDIGNPKDIHPRNKHEVGRRLALWAMAKTYGRDGLVHSGPLPAALQRTIAGLRLSFTHVADGLVAQGELTLFEAAGADGVWHPAKATLTSDRQALTISCANAPAVEQVRYAWGAANAGQLFNSAGLPASSFRISL